MSLIQTSYFAAPVFGIKAKLKASFYWIFIDFAAPVFGIKAKLVGSLAVGGSDFAAPVFGIKAKQTSGGLVCVVRFAFAENPSP